MNKYLKFYFSLAAAALIFTFVSLCPFNAQSVSAVEMSLSDLIDRSQIAVVGKIESSVCARGQGRASGMIFTYYTLSIEETLSGSAQGKIWVRVPGGTIGDQSATVPGMPVFKPGEEAVFFLARAAEEKEGRAVYQLLAAEQAYAPVVTDPASQAKTVLVYLQGKPRKLTAPTSRTPLGLMDLKTLVKARLENKALKAKEAGQ